MALRITRAHEPITIQTVTVCLYALPGIGRTSTGYTAEKPLLLDADKAAYRSKNRRDTVLIDSWSDVDGMTQEDLTGYRTIVVDTVGRVLELMAAQIIQGDPKNATRAGGLAIQGYGVLKNTFTAWLTKIRGWGLDVVLLAHCDEQRSGEETKERLDAIGASKNEVYKVSDAMGRLYIENRKRWLTFSPSDTAFGKNPGRFEPIEVPDFATNPDFLAGVIAKTKAAINAMSAEQTEVAALQDAWVAQVAGAKTPADFDALLPLGKGLDERIRENARRILVKAARDLEIVYDAKAGAFAGKAPAEVGQTATQPTAAEPAPPATTLETAPEAPSGPATPLEMAAKGKRAKKGAEPVEREPGADDA